MASGSRCNGQARVRATFSRATSSRLTARDAKPTRPVPAGRRRPIRFRHAPERTMSTTLALQLAIAGVSVGSIYALVALAIVIPFKASGILNFGQGEIVTFGAYLALVLTQLALPYPIVVV